MSNQNIDFNTLKYNLYEILNIKYNSSDKKIMKAYRNLILNFHPDKNNKNEEDIYYHIIIAKQILLNQEYREQYNKYIYGQKQQSTFTDLKNNFNMIKNNSVNKDLIKNNDLNNNFLTKCIELEKNHFQENIKNITYDSLLKMRNTDINIEPSNINTITDLNILFESNRNNGVFKDQLIQIPENNLLSLYNVNDYYTNIDIAFNNLYIEGGGISTPNYTCYDTAFKLQPIHNSIRPISNIESYNNFTNNLSNIIFKKDKYELW